MGVRGLGKGSVVIFGTDYCKTQEVVMDQIILDFDPKSDGHL